MESELGRVGFDGVYRRFPLRLSPLIDASGQVVKWCGVGTGIDIRKAEGALGALIASTAHDVSQPLSGIITNANTCPRMLAIDPPNIDGARETARRTIRDGNRASDVVSRLRSLFSKNVATIEPVDLTETARETIALWLQEPRHGRVRGDCAGSSSTLTASIS